MHTLVDSSLSSSHELEKLCTICTKPFKNHPAFHQLIQLLDFGVCVIQCLDIMLSKDQLI